MPIKELICFVRHHFVCNGVIEFFFYQVKVELVHTSTMTSARMLDEIYLTRLEDKKQYNTFFVRFNLLVDLRFLTLRCAVVVVSGNLGYSDNSLLI